MDDFPIGQIPDVSTLPWKIGAMESGQIAIDSADDKEVTGFIEAEDAFYILTLSQANTQLRIEKEKLEQLLRRAMYQLTQWQKKYGENNPDWLPPSGDVQLMEDVKEIEK